MKKFFYVLTCLCLWGLMACSSKKLPDEKGIDQQGQEVQTHTEESEESLKAEADMSVLMQGQLVDGIYENPYFGLKIEVPDGWTVLTFDEIEQVLNAGKEVIEEADERLAEDLGQSQVLSLFGIFKYPLKEQVPFNPSILVNGEKLDLHSDIVDGKAFLQASKEILIQAGIPYTFDGEVTRVEIGGVTYGTMKASVSSGQKKIEQRYYATIVRGYAINIVCTYSMDEDGAILRNALGLSPSVQ